AAGAARRRARHRLRPRADAVRGPARLTRGGGGARPARALHRAPRRDQFAHRLDLPGRLETPVEQLRGLLVDLVALVLLRVHHGDEQHPAVPLRDPGEGGARVGGVAVLHARDALVDGDVGGAGEEPVGVLDLEAAPDLLALLVLLRLTGELRADRRAVLPEVLLLQPRPGDQGQVVG